MASLSSAAFHPASRAPPRAALRCGNRGTSPAPGPVAPLVGGPRCAGRPFRPSLSDYPEIHRPVAPLGTRTAGDGRRFWHQATDPELGPWFRETPPASPITFRSPSRARCRGFGAASRAWQRACERLKKLVARRASVGLHVLGEEARVDASEPSDQEGARVCTACRSSRRDVHPSLERAWVTWVSTVRGDTYSRAATSR